MNVPLSIARTEDGSYKESTWNWGGTGGGVMFEADGPSCTTYEPSIRHIQYAEEGRNLWTLREDQTNVVDLTLLDYRAERRLADMRNQEGTNLRYFTPVGKVSAYDAMQVAVEGMLLEREHILAFLAEIDRRLDTWEESL